MTWVIIGPFEEVLWESEAENEILALDEWAIAGDMERYSSAILREMRESDDGDQCVVYPDPDHGGLVAALSGNHYVYVWDKREREEFSALASS